MTIVTNENKENLWTRAKKKVKNTIDSTKQWIKGNQELAVVIIPLAIGGAATICKTVGKHINLRKAESVKQLYCYDKRLGHYWALKRELTNREWLEIDKRYATGERMADILFELKVLK